LTRATARVRVHNRRVQSQTIDLIERVRRRLAEVDQRCVIAGPVPEALVAAAEDKLGCAFPPSYRAFLLRYGSLSLPSGLAVVHDFVGIDHGKADGQRGVVERTLTARLENRLGNNLVVVGLGADQAEWFCLDSARPHGGGELPVLLFDARDNHTDQVFYDDFGAMLREVLTFVEDSLDPDAHSVG
jgi:hypothetical protein